MNFSQLSKTYVWYHEKFFCVRVFFSSRNCSRHSGINLPHFPSILSSLSGGGYHISWLADLLFSLMLAFSPSVGGSMLDDIIKLLELVVELGSMTSLYLLSKFPWCHRYPLDQDTFPFNSEKLLLLLDFIRWH